MSEFDKEKEDEISTIYQRLIDDEPSSELDNRIINAAQAASEGALTMTEKKSYSKQLGIAASLVLVFGFGIYFMDTQQTDQVLQESLESAAPAPQTIEERSAITPKKKSVPQANEPRLEEILKKESLPDASFNIESDLADAPRAFSAETSSANVSEEKLFQSNQQDLIPSYEQLIEQLQQAISRRNNDEVARLIQVHREHYPNKPLPSYVIQYFELEGSPRSQRER